jgi:hypothetical protein
MIGLRACLWMVVASAMVFVLLGCESKEGPAAVEEPVAVVADDPVVAVEDEEPLLLLDDEEPLLLTNEGGGEDMSINIRCHACHYNFSEEEIAGTHARMGIGCEDCHGSCDAHCDDEDNITPPDVMFAPEQIAPFCLGCHGEELLELPVHKAARNGKVCTQCHGDHRMNHRTRDWDPYTGELIQDDNVRMME